MGAGVGLQGGGGRLGVVARRWWCRKREKTERGRGVRGRRRAGEVRDDGGAMVLRWWRSWRLVVVSVATATEGGGGSHGAGAKGSKNWF